jgi:hypothetical protein
MLIYPFVGFTPSRSLHLKIQNPGKDGFLRATDANLMARFHPELAPFVPGFQQTLRQRHGTLGFALSQDTAPVSKCPVSGWNLAKFIKDQQMGIGQTASQSLWLSNG